MVFSIDFNWVVQHIYSIIYSFQHYYSFGIFDGGCCNYFGLRYFYVGLLSKPFCHMDAESASGGTIAMPGQGHLAETKTQLNAMATNKIASSFMVLLGTRTVSWIFRSRFFFLEKQENSITDRFQFECSLTFIVDPAIEFWNLWRTCNYINIWYFKTYQRDFVCLQTIYSFDLFQLYFPPKFCWNIWRWINSPRE